MWHNAQFAPLPLAQKVNDWLRVTTSDTVRPTTCHRCHIFSKGAVAHQCNAAVKFLPSCCMLRRYVGHAESNIQSNFFSTILITYFLPSCLDQKTAIFGLRVKLPPAHLSTIHSEGVTLSLSMAERQASKLGISFLQSLIWPDRESNLCLQFQQQALYPLYHWPVTPCTNLIALCFHCCTIFVWYSYTFLWLLTRVASIFFSIFVRFILQGGI